MKVVIADDHRLMLKAVRTVLEGSDGMEVVGAAETGTQVLRALRCTQPDVLLLDLRMQLMEGLSCLERVRAEFPAVKTVVFSAFDDAVTVDAALGRGAVAFISKAIDPRDLASALRQAFEGTVFTPARAETTRERIGEEVGLSEREVEILAAVARGLSNQDIAKEMWVARPTVKFHLSNIYRKLNVTNRTEAARYAHRRGLAHTAVAD